MVRVFVAIPIDEKTRQELVSVQSSIPSSAAKLKLVEPENLHLTIKFLGEVEEGKIKEIGETLEKAVAGSKGFEMKIKGIGAFPGLRYIRVLWAGVERGKDEIIELQRRIDSALQPLGFRPERNFHPHVTIARVKLVRERDEMVSFIRGLSSTDFGTVKVKEVDLMQSTLTRGGPIYSKLLGVELLP